MNNKRQRNWLFTMLMLVMALLIPQLGWAHSYNFNGFCTDEDCTEKYQPAELYEKDNWYEIQNAGQLYWFAEQVDNGNQDLINANVRLINDIFDNDVTFSYDAENDYAPIATDAAGKNVDVNTLRVWNPIGIRDGWQTDVGGGELADENYPDKQKWFGGHFDGQGFSISGLYFNDESLHCGLFVNLRYTAVIENVIMNNCYLKGKIVGIISSRAEGSTISRCTNNCIIYGKSFAGGILGLSQSRFQTNPRKLIKEIGVNNCINNGTILGHYAGGIIGRGSYTWGEGKLSHLINVGNIIAKKTASVTTYIGEIMGKAEDDYTLKLCFGYDSTNLLIGNNIGKIIMFSKIHPIEDFHNGKVAYLLSLTGEKWGQDLSQPESIPSYGGAKVYKLCGDNYTNNANAIAEHSWEDGICTKCDDKQEAIFNTEKNSYEISNLGQLLWFDEMFGLEGPKEDDNANAFLTSDITINNAKLDYDGEQNKILVNGETDKESSLRGWKTLGSTHNFEGNGHTISGLYALTTTYSRNLTGFCSGEVQNLTLSNAVVIATTTDNIGGFSGRANAPINNCHFKGVVKGKYVGGIACRSYNSITNCSFEGKIYDGKGGSKTLGGLVGENKGSITNCAFIGECIEENKIVRLVGTNSGTISNCYLSSSTSELGNEKLPCTIVGSNSGTIQKIAYDADKLTLSSEDEAFKAFTTEQIKSGEVAYWLNDSKSDGTQVWYQKLGENGDAYPVLTSTGDNKVYGLFHHSATERFYSNDANAKGHQLAYNAEAEDEANGNHDLSYEAGEYTWTDEDKTQAPTVAVTYTCKVCGKTETPQMPVVHDAEHDNVAATCTEEGHNYYKTSYTFNDKAVFSNAYTQTLPALGHKMSEDVTFNNSKSIYQKGCTRENCDHHDYYATSDGIVAAKANDDASAFTVEAFTLNDATAYNSKAEFTVKELDYNRSFSHDKWLAVYVPFSIDCSQLTNEYEMATINNFHEFEQKDGDYNVVLEVKPVTSGVTIPALTPCLIRMKQAPETTQAKTLHFSEASFAAAADKKIDCASVTRYYQFLGTLNAKTSFDETSDFVINEGELWTAGTDTQLSPQRWYLNASDREGSLLNPSVQLSRIAIHVIGGDNTTGIDGIYVKTDTEDAASSRQGIYDLQGRKLSVEPTSGIYIKDGKKYVK